tara:strand:+ start:1173 stop:1508 length:336 start_codon:yes stop_codon:yes gene_type:complete
MNTTTERFIRPVQMNYNTHPDSQLKSDITMIGLIILSILVMGLVCSLGNTHDSNRDCAQKVRQTLSPWQGRLLIRQDVTYARASKWCAQNIDNSYEQINQAKRWPMFPPHH